MHNHKFFSLDDFPYHSWRLMSCLTLGLIMFGPVSSGQAPPAMKARELFYTPVSTPRPGQLMPPDPPAKSIPSSVRPVKRTVKPKDPPVSSGQSGRSSHSNGNGVFINASDESIPLALRYSLLKRNEDGEYVEVPSDAVFHSGDKLRVSVEANDNSYLYIAEQGSSKAWSILFPSTDIDSGSNLVRRNQRLTIPSKNRFYFDQNPGVEKLFIVLTRRPVPDLENLIYSLSGKGSVVKDPGPTPAAAPAEEDHRPKGMMIASNRSVDDMLIGRLRSEVHSRDLVFEAVDDDQTSSRKEKAAYVATPDRSPQARIIADVTLRHE